jgi:ankyrin repeat protein
MNEAAEEEIDFLANYSPKFVNNIEKLLIKQFYSKASILAAHLKGIKDVKRFLDFPDDNDCKPLYYAIKANHLSSIKLLIQSGASVNSTTKAGDPAAHLNALIGGNIEILEYLLLFSNSLYDTDQEGWTIFHCACNQGHLYLVKYLIKKKFMNANFKDIKRQNTGLHLAIINNHIPIVKYLLDFTFLKFEETKSKFEVERVDVNIQNNYGQNALHLACRYGHGDIIELLLKNCGNIIDVNQIDFKGITCLDLLWKWLINYEIVNLKKNEKLQIFYNNKFYMQRNSIIDSSEIDNQLKLIHLLAKYGAKFSSIYVILYDTRFLKSKLEAIKEEKNPLISMSVSDYNSNDDSELTVTPILNYLKCLQFFLKLDYSNMFLKSKTNIENPYISDNLRMLEEFIQEQVYNSCEKQIYFDRIKQIFQMLDEYSNN